ncbi:Nif3-like dinuclear metal center hexameric protein [Bacillus sp. FSL W7-1321]
MKNTIAANTLIQYFESFAPKSYALEGDKNGLMVGSLKKKVKKAMVALDVLEKTIDEAIEKDVDFILAHHPLLFHPLKQIDVDTPMGRMIKKAIEHEITIYAAHTNLDVAEGGVNDLLAERLQFKDSNVLAPTYTETLQKLVAFVPASHAKQIREALGAAGAGHIGHYSHCSFSAEGIGRFRPQEGTNPYIGTIGKEEEVGELRIETIVPANRSGKVIAALVKAHPYEEPAYDLYPLDQPQFQRGLGRIGKVEGDHTLASYVEFVKQALGVKTVRVVGELDTKIRKAAVLGGDGNKYVMQAKRAGADVLITGDLYYHVAQDALMAGMCVIDAGHHIEAIMKEGVAEKIAALLSENGYHIDIFASAQSTEPFQFL